MAKERKLTGCRLLEIRSRPIQAVNDFAGRSSLPDVEPAYY
jgi:hypothetical protein